MALSKPTPKKVAMLAVGCLLAIYFLQAGFRKLDWGQSVSTLSKANVGWILAGLVCLTADYSLRIVRWWLMLRVTQPKLKVQACVTPFMGSMAMNNVLPFRAGDVARVFANSKTLGPPGVVLGTVLMERALDLLTLLVIFFIGLQHAAASVVPPVFVKTSKYFVVADLLVFVMLLAAPSFRKPIRAAYHRSEKAKKSKVVGFARSFFESLTLYQRGKLMPVLVLMSAVIWLSEGGLFWCIAHSLAISLSPSGALFALGIGTLSTLLPGTPGSIGVFDYFMKMGFVAYGTAANSASVCALLLHTVVYVSVTSVGGACMLGYFGKPLAHLENSDEPREAPI